jgi:hypothetical protein
VGEWRRRVLNGKLRDELLNGEVFNTLREAQVLLKQWRRHYNEERPHSSLGYRPPAPETMVRQGQVAAQEARFRLRRRCANRRTGYPLKSSPDRLVRADHVHTRRLDVIRAQSANTKYTALRRKFGTFGMR